MSHQLVNTMVPLRYFIWFPFSFSRTWAVLHSAFSCFGFSIFPVKLLFFSSSNYLERSFLFFFFFGIWLLSYNYSIISVAVWVWHESGVLLVHVAGQTSCDESICLQVNQISGVRSFQQTFLFYLALRPHHWAEHKLKIHQQYTLHTKSNTSNRT